MIARCQPTLIECGPEMIDGTNQEKKKMMMMGQIPPPSTQVPVLAAVAFFYARRRLEEKKEVWIRKGKLRQFPLLSTTK